MDYAIQIEFVVLKLMFCMRMSDYVSSKILQILS
jgi:hypothetical protein